MKKECLFCGEKPESKTSEHIIPQWLISLTGNPNREILVGMKMDGSGEYRKYSFNSFKFPACKRCNENFSEIEGITKPIILKILNLEAISSFEFDVLLDWFDKIRIGLWLSYYNLNKNHSSIKPNFRINSRVKTFDRMLKISRAKSPDKRVNWGGCETPIFSYIPSCFSLIINNIYFLNISYDYLFARRIGFPFPSTRFMYGQGNIQELEMEEGLKRIISPLLRKSFKFVGTEIYQPIFVKNIKDDKSKILFDNEYVKDNSLNYENGIGKIFYTINNHKKYSHYSINPSKEWIPEKVYGNKELLRILNKEVLEWQLFVQGLSPSLDKLPKDEKRNWNNLYKELISTNKRLLKLQE